MLLRVAQVTDDLRGGPVLLVGASHQLRLAPAAQELRKLTGSAREALEPVGARQHRIVRRRLAESVLEVRPAGAVRRRLDGGVRDELVEEARLPLVEAFGVIRI